MAYPCNFRPTIFSLLQAWGISVLDPNKTKVQGGCDGAHPHLPLSFPYGQLTFGFKQVYSLTVSPPLLFHTPFLHPLSLSPCSVNTDTSVPALSLSVHLKDLQSQNQSTVYLYYMAVEYNVSFPQAARE